MHPLLTPTPLLRLLLLAAGAALGGGAWWAFSAGHIDAGVVAYLSGQAVPLCMVAAAAVWALRDKAEDRLTPDAGDSDAAERARRVIASLQGRFAPRAVWAALLGVAAGAPAVAHQLAGQVWAPALVLAGAAVGEAAYSYLLAIDWDQQLREAQAQRRRLAARTAEVEAAMRRLAESLPPSPPANSPNWQPARAELQPVQRG